MPTTTINSVSDLTTWVAGIPADMGGATYRGEMNNTGEYVLSTSLSFAGHSNGSILLTTVSGQSFRDNASVRSNALTYNATNGVAIFMNGDNVIISTDPILSLSGLQLKGDNANSVVDLRGSATAIGIDNCIFLQANTAARCIFISHATIRNSVIISTGDHSPVLSDGASALYFCDLVIVSGGAGTGSALFNNGTPNTTAENCAFFGVASGTVDAGGTGTYTTCMTDAPSPPTGCTTVTYANQFVNTTNDWQQKAGADLRGAGTADATNGATDISGFARPNLGNWDIGAWEFGTTAAATTLMGAISF